jgi:hypothetical protein
MVANPPKVDKSQGRWIIPSAYHQHDARSHRVQAEHGVYWSLAADIDKGDLALQDVDACLRLAIGDVWRAIWSTPSSTPDNKKWRILLPLTAPLTGQQYSAFQAALFDGLAAQGVTCDRTLERPGQVVYLPNEGDLYQWSAEGAALLDALNHPMAGRAAQYIAMAAEQGQAATEAANEGSRSFLRAFRQKHSIDELLHLYGMECDPYNPDLWRHPQQSTRGYGSIRIMRYPDSDRWVSMSETFNSLGVGKLTGHGTRAGDAFDLYQHFNCQGNRASAEAYARQCLAEEDDARYGLATAQHGEQLYAALYCNGAPVGPDAHRAAVVEAQKLVQDIKVEVPEDIPEGEWDVEFPPGVLGEVAKTIYNTSARPVRQYAIGSALHMAAGFFGSRYNIEGFGLNLFIMIVGDSGTGKGEARRTEERIYQEVGNEAQNPQSIIEVFGHDAPASAEGLRQMFEGDYQSRATYTEDADAQLEMLMSSQAGSNGDKLRSAESKYWDNSGKGRIMGSVSYSKKENKVEAIVSPALTIGRDFQMDALRAYLGARNTLRGHGPRQIFIMYEGPKVRPIRGRDRTIPEWLIKVLASNWQAVRSVNGDAVTDIKLPPEVLEIFHQLEIDQLDRQDAGGQSYELLNRVHMNALRIAGLVAAMQNPAAPVVTPEVMQWASKFVLLGANRAIKMMTTGDVGSGEQVRVSRAVKAIVDYIRMPAGRRQTTYRVPKSIAGLDHVICERYLMEKLKPLSDFKGSDTGLTSEDLIRKTIKELVLQEYLEEADAATVQQREGVILTGRIRQKMYLVGPAVATWGKGQYVSA